MKQFFIKYHINPFRDIPICALLLAVLVGLIWVIVTQIGWWPLIYVSSITIGACTIYIYILWLVGWFLRKAEVWDKEHNK